MLSSFANVLTLQLFHKTLVVLILARMEGFAKFQEILSLVLVNQYSPETDVKVGAVHYYTNTYILIRPIYRSF